MKLSVLIPVYGHHELAILALQSAISAIESNDEVIIIDDKPRDSLQEYMPDLKNLDQRVKYIVNESNLGRTETYNKLLSMASGDLFLMLDGDDALCQGINFSAIKLMFEEDESLVVVCGRTLEINGDTVIKRSGPSNNGKQLGIHYFLNWIGPVGIFPHNACVMKRSAALNVGGYPNDIINSDIALIRQVMLLGAVASLNLDIAFWRFHGANTSKVSDLDQILDNFRCVTKPFELVGESCHSSRVWLMRNVASFVISAFHLIYSARSSGIGFYLFLMFFVKFLRQYSSYGWPVLLGAASVLHKVTLLVLVNSVVGRSKFRKMMVARGNYVYID
jgi:glycosyltransferase involved in cell wall biosynthesis